MLRRDAAMPKASRSSRGAGSAGSATASASQLAASELSPEDDALFEKLRAWRKAAAAAQGGIPAYTVFHDATLRSIAVARPSGLQELSGISGVGEAKLAKYGEQILSVLADA